MSADLIQRLERNSRRDSSGCLLWQKGLNPDGYGKTSIGRKTVQAHRAMWQAVHGPIPIGLKVRHDCDNPRCINVDHLQLGTHADNMADRNRKNRQARGEQQGLARLTEEQVRAIRKSAESQAVTAKRFNISCANVSFIRNRKTWAHVGDI